MKRKTYLQIVFILVSFLSIGQEICDNGIDDDNDGLIDLNDQVDCVCNTFTATTDVTSLIQNPSFEDTNYCPNNSSQLDAVIGWIEAGPGTTDYMNTCGVIFESVKDAGLVPFPDGEGIVGIMVSKQYVEYVGACLLSPMIAGTQYTLQLNLANVTMHDGTFGETGKTFRYPWPPYDTYGSYGAIEMTIYGTTSCGNLPISSDGCPTDDSTPWIKLGSINYTPNSSWSLENVVFTPTENITAIMIGPPCEIPSDFPVLEGGDEIAPTAYFLMDNLILNETSSFDAFGIKKTGDYCTDNIVLNTTKPATAPINSTLQWYKDGVALVGSTGTSYTVPAGLVGVGKYQIRLTDGILCGLSSIVEITPQNATEPNITGNLTICDGDTTVLTASGASNFSWSPATGLNDPLNDTVIAKPTTTTTYIVTGSMGNCSGTKEVLISVNDQPVADAGKDTSICVGQSIKLNGQGGNTSEWNNSLQNGEVQTPTSTTEYVYTAKNNLCIDTDTLNVKVSPMPQIDLTEDLTLSIGESTKLSASGGGTYSWTPTVGLSCSDCNSPTAMPFQKTNYCVTVTTEGCVATECVAIDIDMQCGDLFVPTSFSPNEDGKNDKLEIKINSVCVSDYSFIIFDRWGEKVFESDKIIESWDGKYNGKELDNAAFVYKLKMKLVNSEKYIEKTGNVTLIK